MNPKQQRFCEEYVVDSNGTQAAIRAGYVANSAHVHACRLLKNDKIKEYIDGLFAKQRERIDITIDSLTEMLIDDRKLAHGLGQAGAAVSATEKLAKLHGLLSERLKVDVNITTGQMSDTEVEAELDEIERDDVRREGRPWIEARIARYKCLLDEFDSGEFDIPVPSRAALPAPVSQTTEQ